MANFLVVLSLLFAITIIGANASQLPQNVEIEFISSEDMKNVLKQYPNAVTLQRDVFGGKQEARDYIVKYTLGGRVSGDRLVGHNAQNRSWASPQNVQLVITYPASGVGAIVSYVEIVVRQSNNSGQAVVLAGGIGQRNIKILVEAYNTYVFNYNSSIYGY